MQIISAQPKHIQTIAGFQLKMAMETENLRLDLDTLINGVQAVFNNPDKGKYYLTVIDDEIVASLLTTYEWSDWRNRTVLWIQSVYVRPDFRKKGIFGKMYHHIKSIVEKDENLGGIRLYVDKTNKNAQKVYEAVGMNGQHYQLFEWML